MKLKGNNSSIHPWTKTSAPHVLAIGRYRDFTIKRRLVLLSRWDYRRGFFLFNIPKEGDCPERCRIYFQPSSFKKPPWSYSFLVLSVIILANHKCFMPSRAFLSILCSKHMSWETLQLFHIQVARKIQNFEVEFLYKKYIDVWMYICSISFFLFSDSAETNKHFLLLLFSSVSIEFFQRITCSGDEEEPHPHSFSAITTKTSFSDHLRLSLLAGGLITAFSALAAR